jgi:hypothetical protein
MLLGVHRDGIARDHEGPQRVVPGDVCGARNISRVTRLRILAYPGHQRGLRRLFRLPW